MVHEEKLNGQDIDVIGDNHLSANTETPLRSDAFELSNAEKIEKIQTDFANIMNTLGLDMTDDSLKGTPKASTFENKYQYSEMLVEKNIVVYSTCEHHFLPIVGKAHVAYISNGNVVGLSKINRIVEFYAKRPQVQERLTMQIVRHMQKVMGTDDVACVIDAKHLCVNSRGIKDINSSTVTAEFGGRFKDKDVKREFLNYINMES